MANNNRDVELRIRAKDTASKAVETLTDALKDFAKTQDDLAKGSGKTGSLLSELGNAFQNLNSEISGLSALGKVSRDMDRLGGSLSKAEGALVEAALAADKAVKEFTDAANATVRLKQAYDASKASIAQQAAALKESGRTQKQITAELKPQEQALRGIKKELSEATAREKQLATAADSLTTNLERQRSTVARLQTEYNGVSGVASKAASALGLTAVSQDAVAAASKRAAAELAKTSAAMSGLKTGPATPDVSRSVAGYRQQVQAIQQAKTAWEQARAEATRLGAALAQAENPSEQLRQSFILAKAASAQAEQGYRAQARALAELRGAANGSFLAFSKNATEQARLRAETQRLAQAQNQSASSLRSMLSSLLGLGSATQSAAAGTRRLAEAQDAANRGGREALSVFQRIRGQLLGLTAAYIGFYQGLNQIGGVVKSYQTLEAAQSRLGVVFNQDTGKVAEEMDFLNRQASRLGIEFGLLADEYGKFAVAAQAANFTNAETRKVFLSVAEAGRVNKLTVDQMQGVYLSLNQMMSKGSVQSEELRQQLGERLTGAFQIFADAIGVTTEQLNKMLKAGEVSADRVNMLKFAEELGKRFGPQLAQSLETVTAEIGKFQNEIFNAQARVGQGGFMDALQRALVKLNASFRSREGRDFFLSLGAALGRVVDGLVIFVGNIDKVITILKAAAAIKFAQYLLSIRDAFIASSVAGGRLQVAVMQVDAAFKRMTAFNLVAFFAALRTSILSTAASLTTLGTGFTLAGARAAAFSAVGAGLIGMLRGVAVAIRLVTTAVGGWVGILVTLVSYLATTYLADWLGGVNSATKALDEHKRILDEVLKGYDEAGGKTDKWAESIKNVSFSEAEANLKKQKVAYSDLAKEVVETARKMDRVDWGMGTAAEKSDISRIRQLANGFAAGQVKAAKFREEVENIYQASTSERVKEFASDLSQLLKTTDEAAKQQSLAAQVFQKVGGAYADFAKDVGVSEASLEALTKGTEASSEAVENYGEKIEEAIKSASEFVPELKAEIERLKDTSAIEALIKKMDELRNSGKLTAEEMAKLGEFSAVAAKALENVNIGTAKLSGSSALEKSFNLISQKEEFRSTPYWDVNAMRVGYGSDTVTLADGSIQKVVDGMKVSVADAQRDLVRRIGEFQDVIKGQVGGTAFSALSEDVQAALTSLAYNYGRLPETVAAAVKTGNSTLIAEAVRGLKGHNGGINANRREQEARIIEGGDPTASAQHLLDLEKQRTAELEKQAEKQQKFLETDIERIANKEREIEYAGMEDRAAAIAKAREELIASYKKAGLEATKEQIKAEEERAAKLYDVQNKDKAANEARKKAEEDVNRIVERRKLLMEQIEFYQKTGDQAKAAELKERLAGVNTELQAAIPKAIELLQRLGGPDAANAILKMQTLGQTVENTGNKFLKTAEQMNEFTASGIADAFDSFAQAIANGENAVDALKNAFLKFASDFLRQIAQMILKQALFNAMGGATGGGAGGGIAGIIGSLFHEGGVVGRGGTSRIVDPAWFRNATRYHGGGIAGLRPNEVPAILETGEEVLTASDPRHVANGGAGGGSAPTIINAIDSASFVNEALNTKAGGKAILNYIQANSSAVKAALA